MFWWRSCLLPSSTPSFPSFPFPSSCCCGTGTPKRAAAAVLYRVQLLTLWVAVNLTKNNCTCSDSMQEERRGEERRGEGGKKKNSQCVVVAVAAAEEQQDGWT